MKVNFLVIGAAKSATTSLCNALSQHQDVCFSKPKEPQFFSQDTWRNNLTEYHSLFNKKALIYGEGSTNYTKYPFFNKQIYSDIFEYNPKMKLIYIMRHPIDRIVSDYIHLYNRGYELDPDFNKAIKAHKHYIQLSCYAKQIEPYIKQFGREQVKLLFFEDFITQPQKVLDDVFNFLEISSTTVNQKQLNLNKSFSSRLLHYQYDNPKTVFDKVRKLLLIFQNHFFNSKYLKEKPLVSEENRQYILESVKQDILKIEHLTRRDLSHWLTP